jgi:ribose transport system permease protein
VTADGAQGPSGPMGRGRASAGQFLRRQLQAREAGLFVALVVTMVVLTILTPNFASIGNLLTVGRNASEVGIIALGMTIVLITANVDLSVGAVYAAGGIVAGMVLIATGSVFVAVPAGIAAGLLVGMVNGILIGYAGLNSFMVTLATLGIVRGATVIATGGTTVSLSGKGIPPDQLDLFRLLGTKLESGINTQLIIFIALVVIATWLLRSTKPGFLAFATGGNPEAARIVGIRVPFVVIGAFMVSGALAAVAGMTAIAFVGSMNPASGAGLEFDVFAASVIGGASLAGGRGSMIGTLLGALFLSVARNGFILLGVTAFAQEIAIGLFILVAIGIDRWVTIRQSR